jgi:putative nucleotidyltransferase with HDIG domain
VNDPAATVTVEHIRALPTLPTVLTRILSTVADPESSALDLASHIAADQALTATLLRIVNSAYYGFKREILGIADAIVILGFVEVRNLALAAITFDVFPNSGSGCDRVQLWRHSVAAAIASDRCARAARLVNPDTYFVAGLLHDIGKVVFDVLYPERYLAAVAHAQEEGLRIIEMERQCFDCDHTTLGAALCAHWNLPRLISASIREHHVAETDATAPGSAKIVALANCAASQAGLGETRAGPMPVLPMESAQALGISPEKLQSIGLELRQAAPRIDALLGVSRRE